MARVTFCLPPRSDDKTSEINLTSLHLPRACEQLPRSAVKSMGHFRTFPGVWLSHQSFDNRFHLGGVSHGSVFRNVAVHATKEDRGGVVLLFVLESDFCPIATNTSGKHTEPLILLIETARRIAVGNTLKARKNDFLSRLFPPVSPHRRWRGLRLAEPFHWSQAPGLQLACSGHLTRSRTQWPVDMRANSPRWLNDPCMRCPLEDGPTKPT